MVIFPQATLKGPEGSQCVRSSGAHTLWLALSTWYKLNGLNYVVLKYENINTIQTQNREMIIKQKIKQTEKKEILLLNPKKNCHQK